MILIVGCVLANKQIEIKGPINSILKPSTLNFSRSLVDITVSTNIYDTFRQDCVIQFERTYRTETTTINTQAQSDASLEQIIKEMDQSIMTSVYNPATLKLMTLGLDGTMNQLSMDPVARRFTPQIKTLKPEMNMRLHEAQIVQIKRDSEYLVVGNQLLVYNFTEKTITVLVHELKQFQQAQFSPKEVISVIKRGFFTEISGQPKLLLVSQKKIRVCQVQKVIKEESCKIIYSSMSKIVDAQFKNYVAYIGFFLIEESRGITYFSLQDLFNNNKTQLHKATCLVQGEFSAMEISNCQLGVLAILLTKKVKGNFEGPVYYRRVFLQDLLKKVQNQKIQKFEQFDFAKFFGSHLYIETPQYSKVLYNFLHQTAKNLSLYVDVQLKKSPLVGIHSVLFQDYTYFIAVSFNSAVLYKMKFDESLITCKFTAPTVKSGHLQLNYFDKQIQVIKVKIQAYQVSQFSAFNYILGSVLIYWLIFMVFLITSIWLNKNKKLIQKKLEQLKKKLTQKLNNKEQNKDGYKAQKNEGQSQIIEKVQSQN